MGLLKKNEIDLNRKVLADLAMNEPLRELRVDGVSGLRLDQAAVRLRREREEEGRGREKGDPGGGRVALLAILSAAACSNPRSRHHRLPF